MKLISSYTGLYLVLGIISSCTLNKERPDELVQLTDNVLKKHEGVTISVEPVDVKK